MEIKVGEYIKLKRGDIFKIDENTANYYNSNKEFITNEIVKHSKNIIYLIEEGDYVNGYKVIDVADVVITTTDNYEDENYKLFTEKKHKVNSNKRTI